jgi:hypothetical protein
MKKGGVGLDSIAGPPELPWDVDEEDPLGEVI